MERKISDLPQITSFEKDVFRLTWYWKRDTSQYGHSDYDSLPDAEKAYESSNHKHYIFQLSRIITTTEIIKTSKE